MKSVFDVQQLLKRFGTFIYTKNRLADLELMTEELQELFRQGMIDHQLFQQALVILKNEQVKERKKHDESND